MKAFWAFYFTLLASSALATEVDNYTYHYTYQSLGDSLSKINALTNTILKNAASLANNNGSCSEMALYDAVNDTLGTNPWAKLEELIYNDKTIAKQNLTRSQSIYHYVSPFDGPALYMADLGAIFDMNNVAVGTDKIGHFLAQGYEYFQMVYIENDLYKPALQSPSIFNSMKDMLKTAENIIFHPFELTNATPSDKETVLINKALDYGIGLEEGMYGWATTGVKSYGDLIANFNGMLWWLNLTGLRKPSDKKTIFECVNNRWELKLEMNWLDYIDPLWDESTNCSVYSSTTMSDSVGKVISELEKSQNKPFACPTFKDACKYPDKYRQFASKLISPILKCN